MRRFGHGCGVLLMGAVALSLAGCGASVSSDPSIPQTPHLARVVQASPSQIEGLRVQLSLSSHATAANDTPAVAPSGNPMEPPVRYLQVGEDTFAGDRVLVKFAPTTTADQIRNLVFGGGYQVLNFLPGVDWYVLVIPASTDVISAAKTLNANPIVQQAGLDQVYLAPGALSS